MAMNGAPSSKIEHRHRHEVQHQEQRRIHRIAAEQHAQGGATAITGEDQEEERKSHRDLQGTNLQIYD
jgi:hypothetical protein